MKVEECMTREVRTISPQTSIRDAARMMASMDVGALPVGEDDRLIGMITDRDIAIRAVAEGKSPDTSIRDVMSDSVKYCFADEEVKHVADNMGDIQLRRLPVLNREKRLVGIVALGDLAVGKADKRTVGKALGGVSRRNGADRQASRQH